MDQVYLFGLASRRSEWLSTRQTVVAENVANANSPGFKARDVTPFQDVMQATRLAMAGTSGAHMTDGVETGLVVEDQRDRSWEVTHSGNSVSLEQEMLKAGEVQADYSLTSSITKAFHRFYLTSVKA
ncbi:flagellar basal body rod protein FlgB [Aurantimonas sp. Leaf443]|uniref:flagellar basal body rod protein FlgB n=1 Tax=Aurantimonas sp. Leaf443 TaxID=1736378 RepID=UPI0006FF739A|nr:flagellar basal body rod protein FlgB [Aurantimonas sp. Leaf443]KQT86011.1 flagellar biosynthesis protein FlgB [Aurantimonas sp. Leaf443]